MILTKQEDGFKRATSQCLQNEIIEVGSLEKKEYNIDERDCEQSVRKEEQRTLELEGCKDMNQEFNGQYRIRNHSG